MIIKNRLFRILLHCIKKNRQRQTRSFQVLKIVNLSQPMMTSKTQVSHPKTINIISEPSQAMRPLVQTILKKVLNLIKYASRTTLLIMTVSQSRIKTRELGCKLSKSTMLCYKTFVVSLMMAASLIPSPILRVRVAPNLSYSVEQNRVNIIILKIITPKFLNITKISE